MLSLKGIRSTLGVADFRAIAGLKLLEELVLDCDQPPEASSLLISTWFIYFLCFQRKLFKVDSKQVCSRNNQKG